MYFYNLFTIQMNKKAPTRKTDRSSFSKIAVLHIMHCAFCILHSFFPPSASDQAGGKIGSGELDQDGVLAQALDTAPGDAVAFAFSKAEQSAVPGDDQGGDVSVVGAELQPIGVAQLSSVTKIDDLHAEQLCGGDMPHIQIPLSHIRLRMLHSMGKG